MVSHTNIKMQSRRWCFTIFDYTPELYASLNWGIYGCVQGEICPETGRKHLQGFCIFATNQRLGKLKELHATAHWSVMKGRIDQNETYCTKDETADAEFPPKFWGTRPAQGARNDLTSLLQVAEGCSSVNEALKRMAETDAFTFAKYHGGLEKVIRLTLDTRLAVDIPNWRPWQADLITRLKQEPDDRKIMWYCDKNGGCGKSTIVKWYINNKDESAVKLQGKVADMAYIYEGERIVFFDVSRTMAEHMDHLYQFAEDLKNGSLVSTKYQSTLKRFVPPHVVFFANHEPDRSKWSKDRLDYRELLSVGQAPTEAPGVLNALTF